MDLRRSMTGLACCGLWLFAACNPAAARPATVTPPPGTTATATATRPAVPLTATPTARPTLVPADAIGLEDVDQVRLLHEYWLTVAQAADVDPYQMDISAVAISPDGRYLAVGGCSKPLEADLRSGDLHCDGSDPQSAGGLPFLFLLDANAEEVVAAIPENEPETTIADLAFNQDGSKLIYAVQPGKIAVWDIESAAVESTLWEGETSAPRIAVSPDGRWIALKTASQVKIWDAVKADFVKDLPGYYRPQFSADGATLAVYHDMAVVIHRVGTWEELDRFEVPCECIFALSPDLTMLAVSPKTEAEEENAPTQVWDLVSGDQVRTLAGGKGWTAFLLFSPDGHMLWRAGERGDLTAWNTESWELLGENIGGLTPILNLRGFLFSGDGRRYVLFSYLHLGLYGLPR